MQCFESYDSYRGAFNLEKLEVKLAAEEPRFNRDNNDEASIVPPAKGKHNRGTGKTLRGFQRLIQPTAQEALSNSGNGRMTRREPRARGGMVLKYGGAQAISQRSFLSRLFPQISPSLSVRCGKSGTRTALSKCR